MDQNRIYPQLADLPKSRSLCFTGHRPEKLPQGETLRGLKNTLQLYIFRAVLKGYTCFYTGLADGIDYLAADYLFALRMVRPDITVIGIQPCRDYESFFQRRGYDLAHLHTMLRNVDRLVVLPGSSWDRDVFLRRDDFMVDQCSAIIAVCGDGRSGSMHTLCYAKRHDLAYCRIYPSPPAGSLPEPDHWPIEQHGLSL